ncbi:MAG: cobaltochelatase subunit CobN [Burkholderiales bacterium]|nr:cobaltochelatase subunit CobN [Burkholderiales bacterium]
MKHWIATLLIALISLPAVAADKVAILSTKFVLERKFKLMETVAKSHGIELAWTQVDAEGEAGAKRVLDGARMVLFDAPRSDDSAQIERVAGKWLREKALPTTSINVMSPPVRMRAIAMDKAQAQRVFDYYVGGTRINHERLFQYLSAIINNKDTASIEPPMALPNGGIYHPAYDKLVFDKLADYLTWWDAKTGRSWVAAPIIGVEMSSSYISDGQQRMLDETVQAIEQAGAFPLMFYRGSRTARATREASAGGPPTVAASATQGATGGRPVWAGAGAATAGQTATAAVAAAGRPPRGGGGGRPAATEAATATEEDLLSAGTQFPNPKEVAAVAVDEPLITYRGKVLPQVLMVNTFLGVDPEARKAWHKAMGVPVINVLSYRTGTRAEYYKDNVGVSSFYLPFSLTNAEYIGLQDPVVLTANEGGELTPMPEQMNLLVGKAVNLARLQTAANTDKQVALFFWNHPPGEKNQGASNLNVPRSLEYLVARLRAEGYAFDETNEAAVIAAVGQMLRPAYRPGTLPELMKTAHWDFMPLVDYQRWFATLPAPIRAATDKFWGPAEKSYWIAKKDGVTGFVIPRMKLGKLVIMPQPMRSESAASEKDEKKMFHDTKVPLNHFYMATYLWTRAQFKANAIVHFGTHGTQEWTPGKERGLWAYDDPNILVGNTPIIYPYIVDNIGEAIHVKRRGRGVIVSHQTPAFAPAGLSDDFVKINDQIREYQSLDSGLVKDNNRKLIIEQAVKMNIHKDLKWKVADLERDFDKFLRDIEDYLEDLGAAMQPLGLHTLGKDAERAHQISNVMQMLGQPLYEKTGVKNAKAAFKGDYKQLQQTKPYRFVEDYVFADKPLDELTDPQLKKLAQRGREFAIALRAAWEVEGVSKGLSARWIDPSYGGDPIRNPDALHTGRNMYGFDPGRVPTKAAYEAGKQAVQQLITTYQATHGKFPEKLAFTMWSTETMRHLGMLEAQILYAMGVKPTWDEGGRVTGMAVIPVAELGVKLQ